jgi:hypothetical protein
MCARRHYARAYARPPRWSVSQKIPFPCMRSVVSLRVACEESASALSSPRRCRKSRCGAPHTADFWQPGSIQSHNHMHRPWLASIPNRARGITPLIKNLVGVFRWIPQLQIAGSCFDRNQSNRLYFAGRGHNLPLSKVFQKTVPQSASWLCAVLRQKPLPPAIIPPPLVMVYYGIYHGMNHGLGLYH